MKGFLLRCFLGRNPSSPNRAPKAKVTADADAATDGSTVVEANNGHSHLQSTGKIGTAAAPGAPDGPSSDSTGPTADATTIRGSQPQEDAAGVDNATKCNHINPVQNEDEQEAPAPRLSLDCGLGAGPNTAPADEPIRPTAAEQLPAPLRAYMTPNLLAMHRGSVESGVSSGVESAVSDGSSGALVVRGGGTAAVLGLGPGDAGTSRHFVRVLRGRASLDALLMLGALVRTADEAGIMVALGAAPRLERIESGDLPPGEDRDHNQHPRQPQRQRSGERAAAAGLTAAKHGDTADGGLGGTGSNQGAVSGYPVDVDGGGGGGGGGRPAQAPAPAAAVAAAGPPRRAFPRWLYGSSGASGTSGAVLPNGVPGAAAWGSSGGGSGAAAAAAAAAGAGVGGDFTFSPPTVSARLSNDNRSAGSSDARLYAQQAAADAQVIDLFMRLATNASTTTTTVEAELFGSTAPTGERSSAGTAGGMVTGTSTGTAAGTATGMAAGGLTAGRRRAWQRSVSEANRGHHPQYHQHQHQHQHNPTNLQGHGGRSGLAVTLASASATSGVPRGGGGRSAVASAPPQRRPEDAGGGGGGDGAAGPAGGASGGGSAPLLKLPACVTSARRNSWDTVLPLPGALTFRAAAALAAASMLRSSPIGVVPGSNATHTTTTSSGKVAGYSSSRFWPTAGGILQDDSGPASLLLVGALSGQMSLGGVTTSANSLVRLPTGSGSIRDVLSRIQHQQLVQHQLQQEGMNAASSSSWSNHTGLASLFDVHLTAALRRAGAVRTFQRAVCDGGPTLSLSRASSGQSQLTGPLTRQDTSMTFTGGLMQLQLGRNSSSTPCSSVGAAGGASGAAGVSHLGAAAAGGSGTGGGLLVGGVPATQHVRRANLSSVSTIYSNAENSRENGAAAAAAGAGRRGSSTTVTTSTDSNTRSEEQPWLRRPTPQPGSGPGPGAEQGTSGTGSGAGAGVGGIPAADGVRTASPWRARALPGSPRSNLGPVRQQQQQQQQQEQQQRQQQQEQQQCQEGQQLQLQQGFARGDSGGSPSRPWPQRPLPPQRQASSGVGGDSGRFSGGARGCTHSSYSGVASLGQEERGSLSLALGLAPALLHGTGLAGVSSSTASGALVAGPSGAMHSSRVLPQGPQGPTSQDQGICGIPEHRSASLDFSHYSWGTDWGPRNLGPGEREMFTFTGRTSFSHVRAASGGAQGEGE